MYPANDYNNPQLQEIHDLRNKLTIVYNSHALLCKEINDVLDENRGDKNEELIIQLRSIVNKRRAKNHEIS